MVPNMSLETLKFCKDNTHSGCIQLPPACTSDPGWPLLLLPLSEAPFPNPEKGPVSAPHRTPALEDPVDSAGDPAQEPVSFLVDPRLGKQLYKRPPTDSTCQQVSPWPCCRGKPKAPQPWARWEEHITGPTEDGLFIQTNSEDSFSGKKAGPSLRDRKARCLNMVMKCSMVCRRKG